MQGRVHIWDSGNIIADIGTETVYYIRVLTLIYAKKGETKTYYRFNGHGDVIALANSSGAIIKRYKYDSFGVEENPGIFDTNVFRYCGEYYDVETKTIYLRARYYDAETGRFTQQDGWSYAVPGFLLSLNLYTYCWNNPVSFSDSSGNAPLPSWAKKFIAAAAIVATVAAAAAICVATAGAGSFAAAVAIGAAKGAAIGALSGAANGAISGGISGVVQSRIETGGWDNAGRAFANGALNGAADGALSGAITGAVTGGIQAAQEYKPVDIELKYKDNWTDTQRAEANAKAEALTNADTKVSDVKPKDRAVSSRKTYENEHGKGSMPKGKDADHIVDLQLGGKNIASNIQPLDPSVNRSLGKQIQLKIKNLPRGTQIGAVYFIN